MSTEKPWERAFFRLLFVRLQLEHAFLQYVRIVFLQTFIDALIGVVWWPLRILRPRVKRALRTEEPCTVDAFLRLGEANRHRQFVAVRTFKRIEGTRIRCPSQGNVCC